VALGQHVRGDLSCVGIDGKVQLAPLPARPAALFGIPPALPEQLQARAVQHKVDRAVAGGDTRLAARERPAAAAERAMTKNG